ncbi:hypothetical protein L873DRAFT_1796062 [Choiromyces venosus 120613-1]|uniref:Uncharacterized protein n=1 Tax=Choiromyces venosus 120613-1 TaxID=1336337 RepID=A0A3N4IXH7_9PEZI|nr:hypothetical protein L873DRAFT_1796062 [Choiromyces venosus 120613-1]
MKDSGTGSCGRPSRFCEDTPTTAAKSMADKSSDDETKSSGQTSITVIEEVPLARATYSTLLKACRHNDCCHIPSGGNKATTQVDVLGGKYPFSQFNFMYDEPHTEITYLPTLRKYTK